MTPELDGARRSEIPIRTYRPAVAFRSFEFRIFLLFRSADFGGRISGLHGFSLLETVVAVGVTSVLLLGIGSAMLIAGRAVPDRYSPMVTSLAGAGAIEPIVAELQYAISIPQRSERLIEFTVADRNGDGTPEVIRYEWSGTPGDPLTRQYNGGDAAPVLADVRDFCLSYDLETISTETPQGNESAETLLVGYNSSQDYGDYPIREMELYGESFHPVLPADAVHWKVTRVSFYARQSGLVNGEIKAQLQRATVGGLPSGIVLEETTLRESSLPPLYLLQEITYTQVQGLSPQQGLCLVFKWMSGDEAGVLLGQGQNVVSSNFALVKSTDEGASWSSPPGQSLLFSLYGTVTTAAAPQIQNTYRLNATTIRLQTGPDDQATLQTRVRTLNRPEVTQ